MDKQQTWTPSEEIEGLNDPMIAPEYIPPGYIQEYKRGKWQLIKKTYRPERVDWSGQLTEPS